MFPLCSSRTRLTASIGSLSSTVVLVQREASAFEPTTYLGRLLNLSAKSPSRWGHASAKPSYVTRPSRRASESSTSSYLNLSPSSPRENSNDQPPYLKSSAPPGSSITPSSETNSVTTIRPIRCLPSPMLRYSTRRFSNLSDEYKLRRPAQPDV